MSKADKHEKNIFNKAIEIETPDERAAYIKCACGDDNDLIERINALLLAHDEADFLPPNPGNEEITLSESTLSEGPGTVIGRYKLLEKIGEGGMAVVYMAEQETPIRRKVALKIIKLGMDTKSVIARFEAERQALAMMDHPNIAKVLDAGATETGRPYFVMELVTGVSITEYCDKNNLNTKQRLELFIQVCSAVQHAHQKGIIHRDIKPTNVMIAHHDGKPVPKVIDFGIAKAINQKLTEKTLFTRYAHIIGTPAYMSPEQAELSELDIDTRTDIYSLGVLLYELLTGTTPFSEEELRKAGYIEMQRIIRQQEPTKPSTKLSTLGRTLTNIAKHRSVTPDVLRKAVRGDLDWIVMKSLEKDRSRRYETASMLATDIRHHLEHEPVIAAAPGTAYRLGKFLRRHRSQTIATLALVIVAGTVAVILTMWDRDRHQLSEAEGIRHGVILSQAREQYAKAEREAALETIKPILSSKHVGPEAKLLQAGIFIDNRRSDEAVAILSGLLNDRPEVSGAAHSLMARILWESESPNAEKLRQIEEHRNKAGELLADTAEAYFLRAMTAVTIKEQLASLDKALQLEPDHYESRRLRAFTYYASRKYDCLRDDALVMTILRQRDPLGYSLRAVALRESGKYADAIADFDKALALTPEGDPQYIDLSIQRCETLLRMGDYNRLISDAEAYSKLSPEEPVFQYYIFCALTALGEYDKAETLFRQIISPGHQARQKFEDWCAKYVFDTLDAGRSWHLHDSEPKGAAFLPMVEAEETYLELSAKAKRVLTDGFSARWSPDGKKLAFSLGVHGYSGVAVFDPATKETDLLIVPGKDPRWSPDGKYIAFVRDRQSLRLEELATAGHDTRQRRVKNEEIWIMKADGTEPRRIVTGGQPSWSRDSTSIYYQSHGDDTLCSIPIEGRNFKPNRIMACSGSSLSVSPDNQFVAYFEAGSLKITNLLSQTLTAENAVPLLAEGSTAWSPEGYEVCLGGSNSARQKTGLWIYNLAQKKLLRALDGQIQSASWSPNGEDLAFCLGSPYYEIWTADIDPNVSTIEALGPARTLTEHYRQMVALYTRRIETDPMDTDAYLRRAQQYHFLHEGARVQADMRLYSAIVTQGSLPDSGSCTTADIQRIINAPFDYRLVFSAERPVNLWLSHEIPVLNFAFGQKGRCNVKTFKIPILPTRGLAMSLLSLCLLSGLNTSPAHAEFTFGEPVYFRPNVTGLDDICCFSYDGLEMYIGSERSGGLGDYDLWVSKRASVDEEWGQPVNLGPGINSPQLDDYASISTDGLTLYFSSSAGHSNRESTDIYMTTRATKNDPWGQAVNLGPTVNVPYPTDYDPWISPNGLELYFMSWRSGGYGNGDIYVTRRPTENDPWGAPENLGPVVNSASPEAYLSLSPDGLLLLFSDGISDDEPRRPGGYGGADMWVSRRSSLSAPWQEPVNMGPIVNGPGHEFNPRISPDGRSLYFLSNRSGWENYQVQIIPNYDFNSDGNIDEEDIQVMADHWGQDYPLCDVGPFAWGDGVVDGQDLMVLMKNIEGSDFVLNPASHAMEVPCDVILNWTSPKFADTHDVYFGTSFEDVSTADRKNPQGVLVCRDQTSTAYDHPVLLEFEQTYYWRIDEVGAAPDFTIYRGSVLDFTTESYAYPITKIIATASSSLADCRPESTINGSGLDKNDGHSTSGTDMWLSDWGGQQPVWIQYEFDRVYSLHEMWVWNHNLIDEQKLGFGIRNANVKYSTDGIDWTTLSDMEFEQANGKDGYAHNSTVDFGGAPARYVKLTAMSNWSGGTTAYGLSEVRFFSIPLNSSQPTPACGRKNTSLDVTLNWKSGRKAASHQVYFGTDQEAVTNGTALVDTVTDTSFDPGPLDMGRTYYWRIDEVNEAMTLNICHGEVWSFSTEEYIVVDDFESYTDNDAAGQAIWQTWSDGLYVSENGSQVGKLMPPYAERIVVHGGNQSMSMTYNNTQSSLHSQAERMFSTAQDWTVSGADTLTLYFRGNPIDFIERADGSIQMSGGGVDIWDLSDQFRFAYKQLRGDGSIVAKIHSLTDTNGWAKAGVMIRDSLEPTSMYAFMFPTPYGRRAFQNRPVIGGSAVSAHSDVGAVTFPIWLKLERKVVGGGSTLTGYYSLDGENWIKQPDDEYTGNDQSLNPVWIRMTDDVYVGLAVTSHNISAPTIAEFSDVSITGQVTDQWQVEAIGAPQPANTPAPMYVAVEDDAGQFQSVTHSDPEAVLTADWQKWMIPFSDFGDVNMANVKKLYIGVGDRNNPTEGGTGLIYIDDIRFGHWSSPAEDVSIEGR